MRITKCFSSFTSHLSIGLVFILLVGSNVYADEIPDYYEEAGMSAKRDYLNQTNAEYIDPFSGTLNFHYTDLVIPGNGGMDIMIQRSYSNIHESSALPPRSVTGLGWIIHFGRIVKSDTNFCSGNTTEVLDNPILELPDGGRQIFAMETTQGATFSYISRDRWRAVCSTSGTEITVWSPDGTQYDMDRLAIEGTAGATKILYPTKITDRNGNYFDISYETISATGYTLITGVTTSDSRSVTFGYTSKTTNAARLSSITANGQTWNYDYTSVSGLGGDYYYLTKVTRPGDNLEWHYDYKTESGAGQYSIKEATLPHGGTVAYTYLSHKFYAGEARLSTSVLTKTTSDGGLWTYAYTQNSTNDTTTIIAPNGIITYKHFGATAAGSGTLWKVGLLLEKNIDGLQVETYDWDKQEISFEDYSRPKRILSNAIDSSFYAPIQTKVTINRDGTNYITDYSNHDVYGNPTIINQTGNETLNKTITYHIDTNKWIINQPKNETVTGVGAITRAFDSNGNLTNETAYGVSKTYSYTADGDVSTYTDPAGKQFIYSNYKRGIPQTENQPESVLLTRTVSSSGTVTSVNDGRGIVTGYSYNGLNQLTGIDFQINTDVTISHTTSNRTTTRGGFSQVAEYDGFGRVESITSTGGDSVVITYDYNALGQLIFESYPGSTFGIDYEVDALGRVKEATYHGGDDETFEYLAGNKVRIVDQNENTTTYTYRSFGDPDQRDLIQIAAPLSITTVINRNKLGQITSVSQDGVVRTYGYNSKYYLTSIDNPETGLTTYGRDNIGNMISKKVGSSPVTDFTYDDLHRLESINYPTGTPDVTFSYDKNNNLTSINNGIANRIYTYDANDNLSSESLTIDGLTFPITYNINTLDDVDSIEYPSGRSIDYSPNALGRSTKVGAYVTSVTYYANGTPSSITFGNGVVTSIALNNRQWVSQMNTTTDDAIGLGYSYDDNGNIQNITDTYDSGYSLSLGYDDVNRLTLATGSWGSGTLSYDGMGNITSYNLGASINYSYSSTNKRLISTSGSVSRTFSYDNYGNVTDNGVYDFTYDDASNLITATGSVNATYEYDGNNMRVSQTKNGVKTYFIYSRNGNLISEYVDGDGYIENSYLGSKLVATIENVEGSPPSPPPPPPPEPEPEGVTVNTTKSYTISWNEVGGLPFSPYYELYEATDPSFTGETLVYSGSNLSMTISPTEDGYYYYRVRACFAGGAMLQPLCLDYVDPDTPVVHEIGFNILPAVMSIITSMLLN